MLLPSDALVTASEVEARVFFQFFVDYNVNHAALAVESMQATGNKAPAQFLPRLPATRDLGHIAAAGEVVGLQPETAGGAPPTTGGALAVRSTGRLNRYQKHLPGLKILWLFALYCRNEAVAKAAGGLLVLLHTQTGNDLGPSPAHRHAVAGSMLQTALMQVRRSLDGRDRLLTRLVQSPAVSLALQGASSGGGADAEGEGKGPEPSPRDGSVGGGHGSASGSMLVASGAAGRLGLSQAAVDRILAVPAVSEARQRLKGYDRSEMPAVQRALELAARLLHEAESTGAGSGSGAAAGGAGGSVAKGQHGILPPETNLAAAAIDDAEDSTAIGAAGGGAGRGVRARTVRVDIEAPTVTHSMMTSVKPSTTVAQLCHRVAAVTGWPPQEVGFRFREKLLPLPLRDDRTKTIGPEAARLVPETDVLHTVRRSAPRG